MAWIDLAVLVCVFAASVALGVVVRRRGARGASFAAAMAAGFYGIVLAISMTAHIADILSRWYVGRAYTGAAMRYDFRLYSMLLLGALLTWCGIRLVRAALWLARGEAEGRSRALSATALVLLVVVPLIPIQAVFAVALTVLGGVVLLVLALAPPRHPAAARVAA